MKEFELEPGEEVVLEARKHWFIFLTELLPYAILAILPFALPKILAFAPPLSPFLSYLNFSTLGGHIVLAIWLLLVWTGAWNTFTRYFLNAWILTNQRIVDIKQRGYFSREVSSLFLSRVQDVTTEVSGVLPSLLGIGDITVQSAGAVDEFHMQGIPHPERMRDVILRYVSTKPKPTAV
jgi:uncharacterized membrane protein YdbT with pleckstrin-like domain